MQNEHNDLNIKNKIYERKYNAICLTINDIKDFDSKEFLALIMKILSRKIFLILNISNNINISSIFSSLNLTDMEKRRLFLLSTLNLKLYYTDTSVSDELFNSHKDLISKVNSSDFIYFNNIIEIINNSFMQKHFDVYYTYDEKYNNILSLTLKNNSTSVIYQSIYKILTKICTKNFPNFELLVNSEEIKIQPKNRFLSEIEQILGLTQNSCIQIIIDSNFLENFNTSLKEYSIESGSSIYIHTFFDKSLVDVNEELKRLKLIPMLSLNNLEKTNYTKFYSQLVRKIKKSKDILLENVNNKIMYKFDTENGIYDLYDKQTGSIFIPMYEWNLIENTNPLKKLFNNSDNDNNLYYSLRNNDSFLLRGSETYYHFLAYREMINGKDYTTYSDINKWFTNYITFFNQSYNSIIQTTNASVVNDKFILGILDNVRNFLLVLLNSKVVNKYKDSILLNLENQRNEDIACIYKLLQDNINLMLDFSTKKQMDYSMVLIFLKKVIHLSLKEHKFFINDMKDIDYSKIFRTHREIDNFMENYITVILESQFDLNEDISATGLLYGGIELPIIYKTINPSLKDVCLLKLSANISGYSNKQKIDMGNFNINKYGGIEVDANISKSKMILMDDNLMTGKSMQLALYVMADLGINVDGLNIVRYPGVNRIDQMFLNGHTALNYNLFFDYIKGMKFECPYTWRDENKIDIYEDSLGVFDITREKILEVIYKNHLYAPNSEVSRHFNKKNSGGKKLL